MIVQCSFKCVKDKKGKEIFRFCISFVVQKKDNWRIFSQFGQFTVYKHDLKEVCQKPENML